MKWFALSWLLWGINLTAMGKVPNKSVWFQGSVQAAFDQAKKEKKPIFLYWGAVWCPPCNEIKSEVFSRPKFAELMKPMIAVYLDGDTERAQVWGDKLNIAGYPTILMYAADGKEMVRLSGGVDLEEFSEAITSVLLGKRPLRDTLNLASQGKLSKEEWKTLAFLSWGQVDEKEIGYQGSDWLALKKKIVDQIPKDLLVEKAIITAHLLEAAAEASQKYQDSLKKKDNKPKKDNDDLKKAKKIADKIRQTPSYFESFFANNKTIRAVRSTFAWSGSTFATFYFPEGIKNNEKAWQAWKEKWWRTSKKLMEDQSISVDIRLWLANAEVALHLFPDGKKEDLPKDIIGRIKQAAAKADKEAVTNFQRHSVISGAAYMLRSIGDINGARTLLKKELKSTDTPWYYQSSLASLEKEAGNDAVALDWIEKARKSATGRATKLQWTVSDLLMNITIKSKAQKKRIKNLVSEYYKVAFDLKDGFSGRNFYRAKRVAQKIQPFLGNQDILKVIKSWSAKCNQQDRTFQESCKEHFEMVLNQKTEQLKL